MPTLDVTQPQDALVWVKKSVFHKLVKGDATLKDCANSFLLPKQTAASIVNKGCQAMAVIFAGTRTDSLSSMRYNVLENIVVSSQSFVTPERLPPTQSSTKFHCLRVYYQIMVWLGQENDMDTCVWGWKREGSQFVPTESDMNAGPDSLLKIIHCNCTTAYSFPGVAVGRTIYPVPRLVDSANLMSMTIRTIGQYWMKMSHRTDSKYLVCGSYTTERFSERFCSSDSAGILNCLNSFIEF